MPEILAYNRQKAVEYANRWALSRNPAYYDFTEIGGDCTNFASQCLYAGSGVMNFTPVFGWYYLSAYDRAPAWSGVEFLYRFLVGNQEKAVFANETGISDMMPGDIIQLGDANNQFYHSLVVTRVGLFPDYDNILISTHTDDSKNRQLSTYYFATIRYLHILGVYA